MARSKRAKVVPLTQAKKKLRSDKEHTVQLVRDCVDEFPAAYVFRFQNMRNATLKGLRDTLRGSCRFFLGSNKVLQVALGREAGESEHRPGLAALSRRLRGDAGLLFSRLPRDQLQAVLDGAATAHTARAGVVPLESHSLAAGPLELAPGVPFPHTVEPALRAAGVPSRLRAGVVELLGEHAVCTAGAPLSRAQAAVAKMLNLRLATFSMQLDSVWTAEAQATEVFQREGGEGDDAEGGAPAGGGGGDGGDDGAAPVDGDMGEMVMGDGGEAEGGEAGRPAGRRKGAAKAKAKARLGGGGSGGGASASQGGKKGAKAAKPRA